MLNKTTRYALSVMMVLTSFSFFLLPRDAQADQIPNRKITLMPDVDPATEPGGIVKHQFDYTLPTSGNVGSIKYEYCTLAAGVCVMPTGVDTLTATLDGSTGVSGFTLVTTTNGAPYVTRTAASIGASTAVMMRFAGVTNPTATNQTFYVRITSFASTDTSGSPTDTGVVAGSTATPLILTGIMPESLVFCTGGAIGLTNGVPDCASATSGSVNFNQLFSPTDTATAKSEMAASTNAGQGYTISVFGNTLTSGANTIPAMGTSTTGVRGLGQFGMNLRPNTIATSTPAIGLDPAPASNGTNYRAQALLGYGTVDSFKFVSGDNIADSSNGGLSGSDAQIYTNSYIVNVPGSQPAGTYSTTLTYVCTPSF